MQPLFLKIFYKGSLLKTKPFTDDQISIGSGEGLNLQLEGLSPWHVLIEKKLDKFFLFDLGSELGTFVEGEKISGEVEMVSGSRFSIGDYECHFFIGQPDVANSEIKKTTEEAKNKTANESFLDQDQPIKKILKEVVVDAPPSTSRVSSQKSKKPNDKGYWNTFAPPSKIKDLDEILEPSIGNLIEVVVAWKERVISTYHFSKNETVFLGTHKDCQIQIPNMLGVDKYKILDISGGAQVYFAHDVTGMLIQGKDKETRVKTPITNAQSVNLKPYEMLRLDFKDTVKVYVKIVEKVSRAPITGLLNFNFSETVSVFLSIFLTSLLIFYAAFYGPAFLLKDDTFLEKDIRRAVTVKFDRTPVVDYKLGDRNKIAEVQKKKPVTKKVKVKKRLIVPKVVKRKLKKKKRWNLPKRGKKPGKIGAQSPGKKRPSKKAKAGSVRPGGSIKTGKVGSTAKTVAPDPTKVGLLGVFGGGGKLQNLDKGASGKGGLIGLAQESTGYAGTKESYAGDGIGTKTKEVGSGGQGSSLVGISNIKTKGRGGSLAGTGKGGLGSRGRMNIEFGENDIDVDGEIDRAGILRVIRQNRVKFDNCYQFSLQKKSSLQGSLKVQWEILPNGSVRSATPLDDQVGSRTLSNCVARVLGRLNFPAPPSGQIPRVAFKFVFSI